MKMNPYFRSAIYGCSLNIPQTALPKNKYDYIDQTRLNDCRQ